MGKMKIAVTIEAELLRRLDRLVSERRFANRSQAVEQAVADQLQRIERTRLARECAKLDPDEERALTEEGMEAEDWPSY